MPCDSNTPHTGCSACMKPDCGDCKFCLDKRKFGGPGKLKTRCKQRTCEVTYKIKKNKKVDVIQAEDSATTSTIRQEHPEMRNKSLSSVDLDEDDMKNSSLDSLGSGGQMSDDSPSVLEPSDDNLQGCTFEDINTSDHGDIGGELCKMVTQAGDTSELHSPTRASATATAATPTTSSETRRRAKSIDIKCEEINGMQNQVISVLPNHKDNDKLDQNQDLNLDSRGPQPQESLGVSSVGFNSLIGLPRSHTNNLDIELQVLDKKRLNELVTEVDPSTQLDEDVGEVLLQIADDYMEQAVSQACALAKHRKARTIDVEDVQLVLERSWNMWIPGFGADDIRPQRRSANTEALKQRMAIIKKSLKKY